MDGVSVGHSGGRAVYGEHVYVSYVDDVLVL